MVFEYIAGASALVMVFAGLILVDRNDMSIPIQKITANIVIAAAIAFIISILIRAAGWLGIY